jgi:hypothetical protein
MKSEEEIGRLGKERRMVYGIPPLGDRRAAQKRKLFPESESPMIFKETVSPRHKFRGDFIHRPENLCRTIKGTESQDF